MVFLGITSWKDASCFKGGGEGGVVFQMGFIFKWKVTSWAGIGFDGGIFEKNQRMGEGAPPAPPPRHLTSLTVAFCQKSIFDFLYPFTSILVYLNLWDMFRFIFRQLKDDFFHKVMVAEKITLLQMRNTFCKE